jgi:hypothetical protein
MVRVIFPCTNNYKVHKNMFSRFIDRDGNTIPIDDITEIEFQKTFNECFPPDVIMPINCTSIIFSEKFNMPLPVDVPSTPDTPAYHFFTDKLVKIVFGSNFSQSLMNVTLPESLKHLEFGKNYNQCLDDVKLPDSIEFLHMGGEYAYPYNFRLPACLKVFIMNNKYNDTLAGLKMNDCLEVFHFGNLYNKHLNKDEFMFPDSVKVIKFGNDYNCTVENFVLPSQLEVLEFNFRWNQPLDPLIFPESLKALILGSWFRQSIEHVKFNKGLELFQVGQCFEHNIPIGHFDTSTKIIVGNKFPEDNFSELIKNGYQIKRIITVPKAPFKR